MQKSIGFSLLEHNISELDLFILYSSFFGFHSRDDAKKSMLYSYKHGFSGFSAMLNSNQAAKLASKKLLISLR